MSDLLLQSSFASDHTIVLPGASHSVRMCSMDSSILQWPQTPRFSKLGMLFQNLPILKALWKHFHRNSCVFFGISACLVDFQMASKGQ